MVLSYSRSTSVSSIRSVESEDSTKLNSMHYVGFDSDSDDDASTRQLDDP